ncbi:polysaccharide deacetylase family protein [Tunicatimonas pelagia]|uniref:polysaccharide deacetylase family protein n=1 Tax=Tunicatimonas pelagia TaxID=931531 RepID=UPI00266684C5|nr:polysaccharide deacetylase family protein [Tunicatimonas pelagia]WKN40672.1 polysaccharide deacetylase family protein [Tunicatimonas pelagia]
MKYFCLFILLQFVGFLSFSQSVETSQRKVAITIDDLPVVTRRSGSAVKLDITQRLIGSLVKNNVPAIGFVNERKLYRRGKLDPTRVNLLRRWLESGLELGNHTYSHPSLHKISLADYKQEILKGETVTKEITQAYGQALAYFRHPFLHTGRSVAVRDSLLQFLDEHGYEVAPISIDNADYLFAAAYERTILDADTTMQQRVRETYLKYMEDYFAYYEQQSQALLGREIAQTLLLHANALNADTFDEMAEMIRERGYSFVSLAEALEDDAYHSQPDTFTGAAGISWIHRWAITQGKKGDFFQGEPQVPPFIDKLADSF